MAKLSILKPPLQSLPSTLAFAPRDERQYDRVRNQQHWRKWYRTARWKQLRWTILTRDAFTCQRCTRVEGNTSKLVADHTRPHRGQEALFWDDSNIQTLCKPCHDGAKQREERRIF